MIFKIITLFPEIFPENSLEVFHNWKSSKKKKFQVKTVNIRNFSKINLKQLMINLMVAEQG